MGYRLQPTVYRLVFEEHPGLEVMARSVSIEEFKKVSALTDRMVSSPSEEQVDEMFGWFVKRLIGWNLEDEAGKPVPATVKGLMGLELPFAMKIVMAWVGKVVRVDAPLPAASSSGPSTPQSALLEESIPMTASSPPS